MVISLCYTALPRLLLWGLDRCVSDFILFSWEDKLGYCFVSKERYQWQVIYIFSIALPLYTDKIKSIFILNWLIVLKTFLFHDNKWRHFWTFLLNIDVKMSSLKLFKVVTCLLIVWDIWRMGTYIALWLQKWQSKSCRKM